MIILAICLGLIVIGLILGEDWGLLTFAGVMLLFIALVCLPISYYNVVSEIKEFQAVKQTIEVAREEASNIEKAALQHKVIKANAWLALRQYWNSTIFDIWIPDEVIELKPLR